MPTHPWSGNKQEKSPFCRFRYAFRLQATRIKKVFCEAPQASPAMRPLHGPPGAGMAALRAGHPTNSPYRPISLGVGSVPPQSQAPQSRNHRLWAWFAFSPTDALPLNLNVYALLYPPTPCPATQRYPAKHPTTWLPHAAANMLTGAPEFPSSDAPFRRVLKTPNSEPTNCLRRRRRQEMIILIRNNYPRCLKCKICPGASSIRYLRRQLL